MKEPGRVVERVEEEYFTLRALVRYSGLSLRTLRNYLHHADHPLPHFRLPGKILVKRSDFDAWIRRFQAEARRGPSLEAIVNEVMAGIR